MKTMTQLVLVPAVVLTLALAGCSAAIQPHFDAAGFDAESDGSVLPDGAMADGGTDVDAHVDVDGGTDVDGGIEVDGGVGADSGTGLDAGDTCDSLADGCQGMFEYPSTDTITHSATAPYLGAAGDYLESPPQVLPAVLIARHLDLTDLYVANAGGAPPCGRLPEFRVLVNGVEVGRFTPPSITTDFTEHFDFAPIAGTVFTVRIEETEAWCASTLRMVAGSMWGGYAALGAP